MSLVKAEHLGFPNVLLCLESGPSSLLGFMLLSQAPHLWQAGDPGCLKGYKDKLILGGGGVLVHVLD